MIRPTTLPAALLTALIAVAIAATARGGEGRDASADVDDRGVPGAPGVAGVAGVPGVPGAPGGLQSPWLYNGVHRPIVVDVPAAEDRALTLALLDVNGTPLAPPVGVGPGRVDLAAALPDVLRLRRAAWLQMLVDDEPHGSALVLQPMLSRLVPVAVDATNPSGIRYTEIVRWYDETHPEDADAPEAREGKDADRDDPDTDPGANPNGPWLAERGDDARLFSGLRIYPERDVLLVTDHGEIRLAMRPDVAPNTVWNFLELCRGGFYEGIVFHRIVPLARNGDPFVIQAGDPTPTGSGGPGYWLPIEKSHLPHDFGVISMARDQPPDSAGSQVFICLSRAGTARLDGHYCAFGYAVAGTRTILDIAAVELADVAAGRPAEPPVIVSARLIDAPPRRIGVGRPDSPVARPVPPAPESRPARVPR